MKTFVVYNVNIWIYNIICEYIMLICYIEYLKNGNLMAIVLKFAPNFAFARA